MTLRVRPLVDPPTGSSGDVLRGDGTWGAGGGGGGDSITVNGVAVVDMDFDDATPAAGAGRINVAWSKDASSPANVSASVSASGLLDVVGSTRGSLLYRGAAAWAALTPGTSTYILTSNGAGADPSWQAAPSTGATSAEVRRTATLLARRV